MRLSIAVTAALSGLAAAASQADVHLFRAQPSYKQPETTPQLPRQLARLIFLQRLGVDAPFSLDDITDLEMDDREALHSISAYGKPMLPLFAPRPDSEPSHLLVILEGLEPEQMEETLSGRDKSFGIDEAPSSAATDNFIDDQFFPMGVSTSSCSFDRAINPLDDKCFSGSSSIFRSDVKKDKSILEALQKATPKLAHFAETGEMETTVVLLPESSRKSSLNTWWTRPTTLHRRQSSETVLSNESPSASEPTAANTTSRTKKYVPPLCFISKEACMDKTNKCSDGHGKCTDAWAAGDKKWEKGDEKLPCFQCKCQKTRKIPGDDRSPVTRWTGPMCDKTDVSTATNLFLGTALVLFGALALGFKLMYDVGYAPLPPILEAGVTTKK